MTILLSIKDSKASYYLHVVKWQHRGTNPSDGYYLWPDKRLFFPSPDSFPISLRLWLLQRQLLHQTKIPRLKVIFLICVSAASNPIRNPPHSSCFRRSPQIADRSGEHEGCPCKFPFSFGKHKKSCNISATEFLLPGSLPLQAYPHRSASQGRNRSCEPCESGSSPRIFFLALSDADAVFPEQIQCRKGSAYGNDPFFICSYSPFDPVNLLCRSSICSCLFSIASRSNLIQHSSVNS